MWRTLLSTPPLMKLCLNLLAQDLFGRRATNRTIDALRRRDLLPISVAHSSSHVACRNSCFCEKHVVDCENENKNCICSYYLNIAEHFVSQHCSLMFHRLWKTSCDFMLLLYSRSKYNLFWVCYAFIPFTQWVRLSFANSSLCYVFILGCSRWNCVHASFNF